MLKLISRETKDRYRKVLNEMDIVDESVLEKNKIAALYIICEKESLWNNRSSILDLKRHKIKENAVNLVSGSGNKALILLVFNLFNSYKNNETDVLDIVKNVNRQDRDIFLNAINIVWS